MISKSVTACASIGLALSALLTGSLRAVAPAPDSHVPPEILQLRDQGVKFVAQGRYYDAHAVLLRASARAQQLGLSRPAAMNLVSAGTCYYWALKFRDAQKDFERARDLAQSTGEMAALAAAQNNLANLYIHIGQFDNGLRAASEALAGPEGRVDPVIHGKLLFQKAEALAELEKFPDAEPYYLQAISELLESSQFDPAAGVENELGSEYLKAGRLPDAEAALNHAFFLVRMHNLTASGNLLSSLARLRDRRGDTRSATNLFEAALKAPPNLSPVWQIRSHRGTFLLEHGDLEGALGDFREARRVALEMRADVVPADQDRVALESSPLRAVMEGLVDAGNQLARKTSDRSVLHETFDAAEQDRMWSLRALVPSPNDWRSRLPDHYWELLAQYQNLERTGVAGRSPEISERIERLRQELQRIEAAAASDSPSAATNSESALSHAQSVLGPDSVLFSFLVTESSGWVWAVDRTGVDVYPLAAAARIKAEAREFSSAVQRGDFNSASAGQLYRDLFGGISTRYLNHRNWLIEPDAPLHSLPFAALRPNPDEFLVQRVALESIPGALLLERGTVPAPASFVGVGDPIYNTADSRYRAQGGKPGLTLPRLPNTAGELERCARAWGSGNSQLLTGADATTPRIQAALAGNAAIVHFATHVVTAPGDYGSGLIALSLDGTGGMGLLGPKEIVARPVNSTLVVMNGCHSAQGETKPSAGLMGLTRAWIGAGARAVIATGWDVPDTAAESLMTDFYSALRASPERGVSFALREAQLMAIRREARSDPRNISEGTQWASYSLLSRIQ